MRTDTDADMQTHPLAPKVLTKTVAAVAASAAVAWLLMACSAPSATPDAAATGATGAAGGSRPVTVTAGDPDCQVSTTTLPAGQHTFAIKNTATRVTEVYVYAPGDRIVGEVENVGPATSRTLIVDLPAGSYEVACKPGMVGTGTRTALQVNGASAPAQSADQTLTAAVDSYRKYVDTETQALIDTTATLAAAVNAGDLAGAKAAYPPARLHYERVEPVSEAFGELDPLIDMRADDATGTTPFVGFHALEKLLFQDNTLTGAPALATTLSQNVARLHAQAATLDVTPLTMGNGAKSLLDEVAKSKVTGEEERYSRIDLLDFAGNVEGAKYVYAALRPALERKAPQLLPSLDQRFTSLEKQLATHLSTPLGTGSIAGSPYVSYDTLTPDQVRALAVEVDAISEPLGQISGVVTAR